MTHNMPKLEHFPLSNPTNLPVYGEGGQRPLPAARFPAVLLPIIEYAVLAGIVAGGVGFWIAVIWWIAA